MKKIFFSLAVLLPMICVAQSNQSIYNGDVIEFIPKPISAANGDRCVTMDNNTVYIYNNQFQLSKTIQIEPNERIRVTQNFEKTYLGEEYTFSSLEKEFISEDYLLYVKGLPEYPTVAQFNAYLNEDYGCNFIFHASTKFAELDSIFVAIDCYDDYHIDYNNDTIYKTCFGIENGKIYRANSIFYTQEGAYSDFPSEPTYSDTVVSNWLYPDFYRYFNADTDTQHDMEGLFISQTLFNNDDSYEYLRFVYSNNLMERGSDSSSWSVYKEFETPAIGFEILSESGTLIQSVNFDNGFYTFYGFFYFVKIDDIFYLLFPGKISATADEVLLVYRVNKGSSSPVQEVSAPMPSSVVKYIHSGHMYIDNGKHVYSTTGMLVK